MKIYILGFITRFLLYSTVKYRDNKYFCIRYFSANLFYETYKEHVRNLICKCLRIMYKVLLSVKCKIYSPNQTIYPEVPLNYD